MDQAEKLHMWAQLLLWVAFLLPFLGGAAVIVRYYVEQAEKRYAAARYEAEIKHLRALAEPRKIKDQAGLIEALRAIPPDSAYTTLDWTRSRSILVRPYVRRFSPPDGSCGVEGARSGLIGCPRILHQV
jgi:hypothetical protein